MASAFFRMLGHNRFPSVFQLERHPFVGTFANYSATYGSIGGIIVLMIWFYLTGTLLILGGEINALLHKRKKLPDENPYRGSKL